MRRLLTERTDAELRHEADALHWYGIPFTDLDSRHWLPYMTAEKLGQGSPKLTLPIPSESFVTDWALPEAQPVNETPLAVPVDHRWVCAACNQSDVIERHCLFH